MAQLISTRAVFKCDPEPFPQSLPYTVPHPTANKLWVLPALNRNGIWAWFTHLSSRLIQPHRDPPPPGASAISVSLRSALELPDPRCQVCFYPTRALHESTIMSTNPVFALIAVSSREHGSASFRLLSSVPLTWQKNQGLYSPQREGPMEYLPLG